MRVRNAQVKITHKTKEELEEALKACIDELDIAKELMFKVECNAAAWVVSSDGITGELDFEAARKVEKEMLRKARLRITSFLELV